MSATCCIQRDLKKVKDIEKERGAFIRGDASRNISGCVANGIPEADLARVHAPIGLEIYGQTPAEIAVSITGEMIYERACRREAPAHHACPMV